MSIVDEEEIQDLDDASSLVEDEIPVADDERPPVYEHYLTLEQRHYRIEV